MTEELKVKARMGEPLLTLEQREQTRKGKYASDNRKYDKWELRKQVFAGLDDLIRSENNAGNREEAAEQRHSQDLPQ